MLNGSVHPAAALFPLLAGEELEQLADDIKANGLLEPIVLLPDGTLLDGRNRLAACELAGVEPRFTTCTGDDPVGLVVSLNIKRRHLNTGQRAMIGAEALPMLEAEAKERQVALGRAATRTDLTLGADLPQGSEPPQRAPRARDHAAKTAHTSAKAVAQAKRVVLFDEQHGTDLAEQVKAGTLALDAAEKQVKRALRQEAKSERVAKIAAVEPDDLDTLGTYDVLYVDPPWRYEHVESSSRAIENNYPTMTLDEIKALTPPAGDDAVLFMWATSPKLTEALEVVDAWGFEYRTCAVWVKQVIGMGYYFRQRHELLLVAKRGNLPTPEPEDRPDSVVEAPRTAHSAKPDQVYELLEAMYPDRTKVELFARQRRAGWASWGNQA